MRCIGDFESVRPQYELTQKDSLKWIQEAYRKATGKDVSELLARVGCKEPSILRRGSSLSDYTHQDWDAMRVLRLHENPQGAGLSLRSRVYEEVVDALFEKLYAEKREPHDMIHVSCTGYVSPSGAQKIVSKKGWDTTVTHAYHMGCYGAIPAIRMASGFAENGVVDVVHTELCTLHCNFSEVEASQLVVQSLFADGFIKYSVSKQSKEPHFRILKVLEKVIPNSTEVMQWHLSDFGFRFVLAKEVPVMVANALSAFLEGFDTKNAVYAIHPGGPKIVQLFRALLNLSEAQVRASQAVLQQYGNMSSATLPHIWKAILEDPSVPSGTKVMSIGIGPGLTLAGALLEKS